MVEKLGDVRCFAIAQWQERVAERRGYRNVSIINPYCIYFSFLAIPMALMAKMFYP